MDENLTVVTVVFDPEVVLLEVQARSVARYLDADAQHAILVIDNCIGGLRHRRRERLLRQYGPHQARVRFVRLRDLVDTRGVDGWRAQQLGKLLVAVGVATPHYVVLDAKNHLIRPCSSQTFLAGDGRAHGACHSYETHPLRAQLETTLRYLGAAPAEVRAAMLAFPPTAPPFVFDTALVRSMIGDLEMRSGRAFAQEFERSGLLEFFLYSGWLALRGPGHVAAWDGTPLLSPTVWPKAASAEGVARAGAEAHDATVFGVHRQVLARGDTATCAAVAGLWVRYGLAADRDEALRLIARLRHGYVPWMVATRSLERWYRATRRTADSAA